MSVISTHRNSNRLEHNSRSLYLQRRLSPSLKKTAEELRQQSYLDHLNDVYIKNWNEMKRHNETIINLKMERERLRAAIDTQTQQLSSSQSSLLKEEFTLQIQRLREQLLGLHQIRQKQDQELTKSKQAYLSEYQKQAANNIKLQQNLQRFQVQLQLYRNILSGKQVAVRVLQSKVTANSEKIKLKLQYQNKYKQIMGSKELAQQ